jgi:hypothetical protein
MTTLNQAFRTYYSAMADADLLRLAANKGSFIEVAQNVMTEELARRHLNPPVEPRSTPGPPSTSNALAKLTGLFRR